MVESGWNERALVLLLWKGLSDSLQDELATQDLPGTLEGLISLAICIDNCIRERLNNCWQQSPIALSQSLSLSVPITKSICHLLSYLPGGVYFQEPGVSVVEHCNIVKVYKVYLKLFHFSTLKNH